MAYMFCKMKTKAIRCQLLALRVAYYQFMLITCHVYLLDIYNKNLAMSTACCHTNKQVMNSTEHIVQYEVEAVIQPIIKIEHFKDKETLNQCVKIIYAKAH